MDEMFVLSDGYLVKFYSRLTYQGIDISVTDKIDTPEHKAMFKKEIKSERDVVRITF